jgi:hypothetical protein
MAFIPIAHHKSATHVGVVDRLRKAGALHRNTAQPLPDLNRWERRRLDDLIARGVIRRAARATYYLDRDALGELRALQAKVVFSVAVVVVGVIAGVILTGVG